MRCQDTKPNWLTQNYHRLVDRMCGCVSFAGDFLIRALGFTLLVSCRSVILFTAQSPSPTFSLHILAQGLELLLHVLSIFDWLTGFSELHKLKTFTYFHSLIKSKYNKLKWLKHRASHTCSHTIAVAMCVLILTRQETMWCKCDVM